MREAIHLYDLNGNWRETIFTGTGVVLVPGGNQQNGDQA